MPYYSLKDRVDSDPESSMESDCSLPELQTCPRLGRQASPELGGVEKYFFVGKDCFGSELSPKKPVGPVLPKAAPTPELPKAAPTPALPKSTPTPVITQSAPAVPKSSLTSAVFRPILPKPSTSAFSKSALPPVSRKSSTPLGTGFLSVLKTPKPVVPKGTPLPGPSTSAENNLPWVVHSQLSSKTELESLSPSSAGSSHYGVSVPEDDADSSFEEADKVAEPKQVVLPDWNGLLFRGTEKFCDDILTYPELDTSYEDSKLAEDVALNFVANYNMPLFPCFTDFQNFNKVSHAVKSIPKKFKSRKEQLVALLLMFDYLSCCCQEGNILHLYDKCKKKNKVFHLESLDQNIRLLLDRLHSDRLTLEQLRSVNSIVTTCIERIPSSMKPYFSAPPALKRKLKVFEMEEKNQKENSVYNFTDEKPTTSSKKLKLSSETAIKSTSKKWELEEMDYNDLLRTPTKSGALTTTGSPLLASTPQSGWSVSGQTLTTSNKSPFKRDLVSTSTLEGKKSCSSKSSAAQKSDSSKSIHWLFQTEKTPTKVNTVVTSLASTQKEISKEVSGINISKKKPTAKVSLASSEYFSDENSSDSSLPDIPDLVVPEVESSSSYSSWKKKVLGNKPTQANSTDSNLNSSEMKHQPVKDSSTPTVKSPFKASHNTWKSKYESPSKTNQRLVLGKKY